MNCEICQKGPANEGVTVFRVNEKGGKGIYRCWKHLTSAQAAAVDLEVIDIVNVIAPPKQTTGEGEV